MADITQNVTVYSGTVPDANSMSHGEFDAAATELTNYWQVIPPELNAWSSQANSLKSDVNGYRATAVSAKNTAVSAKDTAVLAKNSAEAAAAAAQSAAGLPALSGNAGRPLTVNASENGVEWAGGNYLASDTPNPKFTHTGALKVPTGTAAQRPGSPTPGQLRYNTTSSSFEGYDGSAWGDIGGSAVPGAGGAGGAGRLSISSNTQLTTSSPKKLAITATSSGLRVNLPLATDLDEDGALWVIANTGATSFAVMDYDNHALGANMGSISPNQARAFFLVDKAAGTWVIINLLESSTGGNIGSTGYVIDPNTGYVFESNSVRVYRVAALSDTKVLVGYVSSSQARVRVLTVSGTSISASSPYTLPPAGVFSFSLARLSDTKAIATYRNDSTTADALILSVSGTTITAGTPFNFQTTSTDPSILTPLSETKVIARTYSNNTQNYVYVLTISGTTITKGGSLPLDKIIINGTSLSDTQAIGVYADETTDAGTAVIFTVSGTAISEGTPVVFESGNIRRHPRVARLSPNKVIVAYSDEDHSDYGKVCILSVSGTSMSPGTPVTFEPGGIVAPSLSITPISDTKVVVAYANSGNSNFGTARVIGIDGTVITVGDAVVFNAASTSNISVERLSSNKVIVSYRDNGNSGYGTAQILEVR